MNVYYYYRKLAIERYNSKDKFKLDRNTIVLYKSTFVFYLRRLLL